jgi:hypothetical protein
MTIPLDYDDYAKLLERTGKDSLAVVYFLKGLNADSSSSARKKTTFESISDLYVKQKKNIEAAQYLEKTRQFKTGLDGVLENKIGKLYQAAAMDLIPKDSIQKRAFLTNPSPAFMNSIVKADTCYSRVCQSNPKVYYGFLARARLANIVDFDLSKGLARPFYEKTIEVALANTPDAKPQIIEGLKYLSYITYNAYVAAGKDKEKSAQAKAQIIEILNKILTVDPTNGYAIDNLKILTAPPKKPAAGAVKK